LNLRRFLLSLALLSVLLAGSLTVQAAPSAQAKKVKVTQAGFLVTTMAPVFVAIENGYLAEEGIDFRFVEIDSGALGAGALVSGLAEITDLGVQEIANLQAQKKDVMLVYSIVNSLTMNLVVRTPILVEKNVSRASSLKERFAALKGLKIGITRPGAPTELYARWMLLQAGLDPNKDVTFVTIGGGAALLAALESGKIDAYLLSPPTPFIAEKNGTGKILIMNSAGDVPEFKDFAFTSIAVRRKWAEENPKVLEGYSRALDKAYEFMAKNTDKAVQILQAKYFPDTAVETLKISIDATLSAMIPDGEFTETAIKNQLQVLKDVGVLDKMPDTSEGVLWSNKWNPKTLKK